METFLIILSYILVFAVGYLTCYFSKYRYYKTGLFYSSVKNKIIEREGNLNNMYWLNMPDFNKIVFSFKDFTNENFLNKETQEYLNEGKKKKIKRK